MQELEKDDDIEERGSSNWWLWLLGILVILVIIYLLIGLVASSLIMVLTVKGNKAPKSEMIFHYVIFFIPYMIAWPYILYDELKA